MGKIYVIRMKITTHYPMYEGTSYDDTLVGDWADLYGVTTKEHLERELLRLRNEAAEDLKREKASGKAYSVCDYDYITLMVF